MPSALPQLLPYMCPTNHGTQVVVLLVPPLLTPPPYMFLPVMHASQTILYYTSTAYCY